MATHEIPPPPKGGAGALLPPDAGRDRPLFVVAAILVFLACIAALGARGAWQQAETWTSDLETSLTIQIRPVEGRDVEADVQQAAEIIGAIEGVDRAIAHDRAYAEALVAPWLGDGNIPDDLPLPLLVLLTALASCSGSPCSMLSSPSSTVARSSLRQWAAVTTCLAVTRAPPHRCSSTPPGPLV